MKCRTVYRFICEHLDDQSESKRFHVVREHLNKCAMCRRMMSSLKKTVDLYCAEPPAKVPPDAHRKLMSALKEEQQSAQK